MPIAKVHRISAAAPDDVSGIEAAIAAGRIDPEGVIAILGKTEGNGLVNDFARGYASLALSLLFQRHLPKAQADKICLVMSGGTEGGMAPHWTIFERADDTGASGPALAIGRAHTAALPAEHLGRMAQVDAWLPESAWPWRMPGSTMPATCTSFRSSARCSPLRARPRPRLAAQTWRRATR
jgi:cyanuric acid amidohydrolase